MKKVTAPQVATPDDVAEHPFPPRVQEALGELVGQAKEGLLALSVGLGLGVVAELMDEEVEEACGPKGKWNPDRVATRHGQDEGAVTLGGRRVSVRRPRMRTPDREHEVPLRTYEHFADRDPLTRLVLEQMLAGVSARRFRRTREPVGGGVEAKARSTSRSATSRAFEARTRGALEELMSRRLDDVRLAALMVDGLELAGRTHVVALGITTEGVKVPLGLWEGSTENATVATALLADLVDRGLDTRQGVLVVIDGAKALRKAIGDVLGTATPVQRCIRHKERNVLDHLAERERPALRRRLRAAWAEDDHGVARRRLEGIAAELARTDPDAARSLREGLSETLTVTRLGITGALRRTLSSTNPCESMISVVRTTQRNVKRWRPGDMRLRWTAAGMLEAERQFRKVIGYRDLARLAVAIERELAPAPLPSPTTKEVREAVTV
jgi:putative transposase